MTLPFVRFWGPITEIMDGISEASFQFFRAFHDAGFPVRMIPIAFVVQIGDYADYAPGTQTPRGVVRGGNILEIPSIPAGRWAPYSKAFGTPMAVDYLNVVCGPNFELGAKFTPRALKNIAIVVDFPESSDVSHLKKYDLVWTIHTKDASFLSSREVKNELLTPSSFALVQRLGAFGEGQNHR